MIKELCTIPRPPELKVRGSNPLGHATLIPTFSNDSAAIRRVSAGNSAQVELRPDTSECPAMTRVLSKVRGKFLDARSGAQGCVL